MFCKQAFQAVERKNRFPDLGLFRVDGVVEAGAEIGLVGNSLSKFRPVQVAIVEDYSGQVGAHEIDRDNAAIGKSRAFDFQRVEFGKVEHAVVEADFKYQFVAHRKVDILYLAVAENDRAQCHIIDFGTVEIAMVKRTIDEGNVEKSALAEVAIVKNTTFKFLKIDIVHRIADAIVFFLKEIIGHFGFWLSVVCCTAKKRILGHFFGNIFT